MFIASSPIVEIVEVVEIVTRLLKTKTKTKTTWTYFGLLESSRFHNEIVLPVSRVQEHWSFGLHVGLCDVTTMIFNTNT